VNRRAAAVLALVLGLHACSSSAPGGADARRREGGSGLDAGGDDFQTDGSCRAIDACLYACGPTDKSCIDGCMQKGTADARAKLAALDACHSAQLKSGCGSSCASSDLGCAACLDAGCASELAACFGVSVVGEGARSCAEGHACMTRCKQADTLCVKQCLYSSSKDAQAKLIALDACQVAALAAGCKSQCAGGTSQSACLKCLDQTCKTQSVACLGK
jgi:hypothetical protein